MKIFMTGGTGFVGTTLTKALTQKGHRVTILSRSVSRDNPLPRGAAYLEGNPTQEGVWQKEVLDHEVIINLAGSSIFRRWTKASKKDIRDSRILTTQNLVKALSSEKGGKRLLLSTSAVGYYGFHDDEELDEEYPSGDGFLASLVHEWESTALKAEASGVRVVLLRFGAVLGKNGWTLKQMVPIFKYCLGAPLGSGKQWFSWIHEKDLASIYQYVLERDDISGPINCTAPNPVRNKELTRITGEVMGKPTFMPAVPGFMIKMIMGEFGSIFLKGQKALPKRLSDTGFRFQYPEIKEALKDLLTSS